jgi:hypothetical protein
MKALHHLAWIIRHPVFAFYWHTTGEPYSARFGK